MLFSRSLLVGASLIAMASTAYAADLIVDEAPAPVVSAAGYDWTGLYVGAFVGAASGTVEWEGDYADTPLVAPDASGDFDVDGWLGGLTAGANFQTGSFVLGLEGDIGWADISGEGAIDGSSSIASLNVDYLGTLRARAGVAFDSVLLYATAGFAYAGGSIGISDLDLDGVDGEEDATFTGWTAGVGAEVAITDNISVKGEYLYTALSSDDVVFSTDDYNLGGDLTVNGDLNAHTFKLGVNYSF
jgi:outer membrane immunogenic protein